LINCCIVKASNISIIETLEYPKHVKGAIRFLSDVQNRPLFELR